VPASFVLKYTVFFVNDEVDTEILTDLSDSFYESDYDIAALMKLIFTSDWFYEKKNRGVKIKSPLELLLGLNRSFSVRYEDPDVLLYIQKLLGQQLFFPPNVSGWVGGKTWIDSSSLMLRLKLPSVLLNNGIIDLEEKQEPEEYRTMKQKQEEKNQSKIQKKVKTTAGWEYFLATLPKEMNKMDLADFLLQAELPEEVMELISEPEQNNLKKTIIQLLSLPEYQMC